MTNLTPRSRVKPGFLPRPNKGMRLTRGKQAVCRAAFEALEGRRLFSFNAAVNYPAGASPQDVAAADVNGDGRLDLVATNYSASTVSVLLGNANGTFQSPLTSPAGTGPL